MALDAAPSSKSAPALTANLDDLRREAAIEDSDFTPRRNEEDLLQLAHYQRILETLGMATADGRFGGIIGTERRVVWYELDALLWRTPSLSETSKLRSTMERYDFEFDFRLDIIAIAQQHKIDPSVLASRRVVDFPTERP